MTLNGAGKSMRLDEFRIQNYKKIHDTGWVTARQVTCFIGKNEAGKSAIFRGLSKLNPSDGEKYDDLKEFPRKRYTAEFHKSDWPAASARFTLEPAETEALTKLCPEIKGTKRVEVTRFYSGDYRDIRFLPEPHVTVTTLVLVRAAADEAAKVVGDATAPDGKGDQLKALKQGLAAALSNHKPKGGDEDPALAKHVQPLVDAVKSHANEEWQKGLLAATSRKFDELLALAQVHDRLEKAQDWVTKNLPRFVYFDKYDVLEGAVHIPTFTQLLQSQPKQPRNRVTLCLFKSVGLDLAEMLRLGQYQQGQGIKDDVRRRLDELAIKASSASTSMTKQFEDWWEQRRHKFHYDFQGEYFRIWVSDDLDPSEIELDQRSQGLQYFFSFYLVFRVEAGNAHAKSILLLDEPGLHLHGTAQAKIIEFAHKLSGENQILYTTHSPFMVNPDHLEEVRAVYEHEDGTTKVSENVWPRDRDSLFPLQAALGYQLAQGLFLAKRQVIVEGPSDYALLKAASMALDSKGRTPLRNDLVFVPAGGASRVMPLASMLMGHEIEVGAVLDGDEMGRREGKKLAEKLLTGPDNRILFVGDFAQHSQAEIEDLFPADLYLDCVRQAYPRAELDFSPDEKKIANVIDRVAVLFARKKLGGYEKWRAALILRDRLLDSPKSLPDPACERFEKLFAAINGLFPITL